MKEIIVDMRDWNLFQGSFGGDEWADCPQRAQIETAILDLAPGVVRVKITKVNLHPSRSLNSQGSQPF